MVTHDFMTDDIKDAENLAADYIQRGGQSSPEYYARYNNWSSWLKVVFLEKLLQSESSVTIDILNKIDADLNIFGASNYE